MSRPVLNARALSAAALLAGTLAASSVPALAQDGVPDLRGSWTGETTGGATLGKLGHVGPQAEPHLVVIPEATFTLTIEQQEGAGLVGTWKSPSASETLLGVVRSDNKTVLFVDEDSFLVASCLARTPWSSACRRPAASR